jgi:hypothetical protein
MTSNPLLVFLKQRDGTMVANSDGVSTMTVFSNQYTQPEIFLDHGCYLLKESSQDIRHGVIIINVDGCLGAFPKNLPASERKAQTKLLWRAFATARLGAPQDPHAHLWAAVAALLNEQFQLHLKWIKPLSCLGLLIESSNVSSEIAKNFGLPSYPSIAAADTAIKYLTAKLRLENNDTARPFATPKPATDVGQGSVEAKPNLIALFSDGTVIPFASVLFHPYILLDSFRAMFSAINLKDGLLSQCEEFLDRVYRTTEPSLMDPYRPRTNPSRGQFMMERLFI